MRGADHRLVSAAIRRALDGRDRDGALGLRRRVFCEEQGVPLAEEVDGRDDEAVHLVAVRGHDVVGTCRLLLVGRTAQFSRLAVAPEHRRAGVATALLRAAEQEGRAASARRMILHAQTYALALYESNGFHTRGSRFHEAGIEHVAMEKRLG